MACLQNQLLLSIMMINTVEPCCIIQKQKTFALSSAADYKCKIIENQFSGLHININGQDVYTKLTGELLMHLIYY